MVNTVNVGEDIVNMGEDIGDIINIVDITSSEDVKILLSLDHPNTNTRLKKFLKSNILVIIILLIKLV
jgi:hypothetical protein